MRHRGDKTLSRVCKLAFSSADDREKYNLACEATVETIQDGWCHPKSCKAHKWIFSVKVQSDGHNL